MPENLHFDLIEVSTTLVLDKLRSIAVERRRLLERLRSKVRLHRATEDPTFKRVVGVDAGHNGESLASAFVPLYTAVAVLLEGWRELDSIGASGSADVWSSESDPARRESLLHFALQFHVAREAISKWKPDIVLVDGPILLNALLQPRPEDSVGYKADFALALAEILFTLERCKEEEIPIIGFVKRSSASHLHRELRSMSLRDSILLNPIMQIGSYTEPQPVSTRVSRTYARFSEKLGVEQPIIYTFYIKSANLPPYKVECPAFCLRRVNEIASLLVSMAGPDGIPHPIAEADRMCRLTRRMLLMRRLAMHEKALDMVSSGLLDQEDLDLLIPQFGEHP